MAKHPQYDRIEIKRATLGYYERPITVTVERLIPTWILEVDFFLSPQNLPSDVKNTTRQEPYADGYIFLPATEDAIPLVAVILNPADGQSFFKGDTISLKGDARFGTPPYTYRWSSDADGYLGEGQGLSVNSLSVVIKAGSIVPHTITLNVQDSAGNSATDGIKVSILPQLCDGDFDCDGDVDGSDLAVFAADFNDVDVLDLAVFAADFGRTDCPPCTQACCLPDGDCVDVPPDVCKENYLGEPQGTGTNCNTARCLQ